MENGAFTLLEQCSILHNIFKYTIFQRHHKALLWSKGLKDRQNLKKFLVTLVLGLNIKRFSRWLVLGIIKGTGSLDTVIINSFPC